MKRIFYPVLAVTAALFIVCGLVTPVLDQKVYAVDLGVTTDAACCIMDSYGTILARKFINCGREKDLTEKMLWRVKVFQRLHGSHDSCIL